ncbi:hypothetical protein MCA2239 [Methylococcus capsulatus str. Bath]|uniref:Uncharacterized protein n=1 Tax=Methylococcus capsulatus (strain ATCC 33009 / NCIMB 11132 / Bath) TaxID=243233 RepID=Q605P1_METCA|nr:hypothetical protein MCA2239 [Methylococcus capsulatus str. Bath]
MQSRRTASGKAPAEGETARHCGGSASALRRTFVPLRAWNETYRPEPRRG